MLTAFRSYFVVLFLSLSLLAGEEQWTPERVPTTGTVPFVLYYQQFLRANPFAIDHRKNTPEQQAENRQRHQQAAALYHTMSKVAMQLAQSDTLPPVAPEGIKKEKSKKNHGTWNLYQNVPINAADLRQEGLWMTYEALSHQVSLDPTKIGAMYDFVQSLEESSDPSSLYQYSNRSVCLRALSFVYRPLKEHTDKPDKPSPSEAKLAQNISLAIGWFLPFVQQFPNEENIKQIDTFFEVIELFRAAFPESKHLTVWTGDFCASLDTIREQQVESFVLEYALMYEGILRRWNLLGNPMPIWGADLDGNIFDNTALKDKVVLLDFWATWCGPCLAEFPHLRLLYDKYKDRGLEIVGYSVDADREVLRSYLAKHPVPWIVLSKESTAVANLMPLSLHYGAKSLPVVLLRDRSGNAILLDARGEKLDDVMEMLFH